MKSNGSKILGYAAIVLAVLVLISFLAGFLAWVWAKLVLGFAAAAVIWLFKKAANKPTSDGFIVWWGLAIAAILVALDLATRFLAVFGWLIIFALIVGVAIWAIEKAKKKI
jgi:hypothetical protein